MLARSVENDLKILTGRKQASSVRLPDESFCTEPGICRRFRIDAAAIYHIGSTNLGETINFEGF
jgi:hypothetical protein